MSLLDPVCAADRKFTVGDFIEIVCRDGAGFRGFLIDFTDGWIVLTGPRAFPHSEIATMLHWMP